MNITTIADAPLLGADYIQLVIENTQKGLIESERLPDTLQALGQLAGTGTYILEWQQPRGRLAGVIFPETIKFDLASSSVPHIQIPVEGQSVPLRLGPFFQLQDFNVIGA